jgi:hypothetical protein
MYKRFLIALCLFSVIQATPMLYTFEGNIDVLNQTSTNIPITYNFILDFDQPALYWNYLVNDFNLDAGSYWIHENYGSVETNNFYFPISEDMVYSSAMAMHQEVNEFGSFRYSTQLLLTGSSNTSAFHRLMLTNNSSTDFEIGVFFYLFEEQIPVDYSVDNIATGSVVLKTITPVPEIPSSVPEPGMVGMMIAGVLGISMLRTKHKLCFNQQR